MIQKYLKELLEDVLPDLTWTYDYRVGDDEKGTVYYESGSAPGRYDVPNRFPNYMVYITSADWDYAEAAANIALDTLHGLKDREIIVESKRHGEVLKRTRYKLFNIEAQGEPNDLGVNKRDRRDFSVNFSALITEMKEEI